MDWFGNCSDSAQDGWSQPHSRVQVSAGMAVTVRVAEPSSLYVVSCPPGRHSTSFHKMAERLQAARRDN